MHPSLIASIGALFGLFLGCSALSIVHMVHFMLKWMWVRLYCCRSTEIMATPVCPIDMKDSTFHGPSRSLSELTQSQTELR